MKQLHLIKIVVNISKITIAVKFPCSLKVHLRSGMKYIYTYYTDQQSITTKGIYPLKQGKCQINQQLQLDFQSIYDTQKHSYQQNSISLAATIASSNSNIPAGVAIFNPFTKKANQQCQLIESLQKCSDRQAKIYFTIIWSDIKKIKDIQNQHLRSSKAIFVKGGLLKNSSFNRLQSREDNNFKSTSKEKDFNNLNQSMNESRVKAYNNLPARFGGNGGKQITRDRQRVKTNITYNNYTNQSNQRRQNALKSQVELITLELEKYKQKCRNFERKERELMLTIKDLKDNVEKKKNKVMETESNKASIEMMLNEKQKQIKDAKLECKKLAEKLEDMKITTSTLQRKLEIKQKAFQQQLKIYQQKISLQQKQLNKKQYQHNQMLQKLQQSQKTNQLSNKQKQKRNIEQRTLLIKKIEHLNQQIQKLKQINEEKQNKFNNLNGLFKALTVQETNKTNTLNKLETDYQLLKTEFNNEKNHRVNLEKELEMLSAAESDKNIFKKRYNQTFQQLTKANQKNDRITSSLNTLTVKYNDLQQKHKQLTKSNKQTTYQLQQTTNQLDNLKKQHSTLSSEYNSLSAKHLNMTQKMNDTKSKLDAEKQEFNDMQAHYQDKLNYLLKTKEYVENEVEDWKQKHQKQQSVIHELEIKNKSINEQILLKHEQYLKLQENHKKTTQILDQHKTKIQHLQIQIQGWIRKQKSYIDTLKQKGNNTYDLQKKIAELEQELFISQEKIQSLIKDSDEKQHLYEKNVGEKDRLINQRTNELEDIKTLLFNTEQQLQKTAYQLGSTKKDLLLAEDSIKQLTQSQQNNQKRIQQLTLQIQQNHTKIASLQQQLQSLNKKSKQLNQNHKYLDQRWIDYRQTTTKALQQLIDQLSKDQDNTSVQLFKFTDSNLSTMQINSIKNRNQIISKYRLTITSLEQQLQFYKKQISKNKQLHLMKQSQLEKEIVELKGKITQLHDKFMSEKEELNKSVGGLEEEKQELVSEIERLKSNIANLEEINNELSEEKLTLQVEIDSRDHEITLLEEQILEIKSNQIKEKNVSESSFKDYKQQMDAQVTKIKLTLSQTSSNLLKTQTQKQQKQSIIQQLQQTLESIKLQLAKQSNKKQQLQLKCKQLQNQIGQLRSNINTKNKSIQDLTSSLESSQQQCSSLEEKISILQTQRKQTYQTLTQTQILKQKLLKNLQQQKQSTKQLKSQLFQLQSQSSSTNQQSITKIKQQKDTITKLESEIELKTYVIEQLEKVKVQNQLLIKELNKDLEVKKQVIQENDKNIQALKNKIMKIEESQSGTSVQLQSLQEQNSLNLEKITELENQIAQLVPKSQQLVIRLQQISQMSKKLLSLEDQVHKLTLSLQNSQNQTKNITQKLNNKQQQYRKKIISLETDIAQKQIQAKDNQTKSSSQWEREKSIMMKELEDLDKQIRDQQQELNFRIDQLEEEKQSLNNDCLELSNLLQEKQEEIMALEQLNAQSEQKISDLNNELKSCLQAWDKQKAAYLPSRKQMTDLQSQMSKFQQYATQLDSKTKQLLQVSRKKGSQQSKFGITDLLRDLSSTLSKSKVKLLTKLDAQDEKQSITNQYKSLQDKIDSVMRSQNVVYK